MAKKKSTSVFMGVFDVLFIMILCFATLLTTMLMQGGVLVGGSGEGMSYHFSIVTFLIVVAGLAVYLTYIIPHSDKELREMIQHLYASKESKEKVPAGAFSPNYDDSTKKGATS